MQRRLTTARGGRRRHCGGGGMFVTTTKRRRMHIIDRQQLMALWRGSVTVHHVAWRSMNRSLGDWVKRTRFADHARISKWRMPTAAVILVSVLFIIYFINNFHTTFPSKIYVCLIYFPFALDSQNSHSRHHVRHPATAAPQYQRNLRQPNVRAAQQHARYPGRRGRVATLPTTDEE